MPPTNVGDQKKSQRTVLLATDNKNSVLAEVVFGQKPNQMAYSAYGCQSAEQDVRTRLGFNGELREAQTSWYLLGNGYRAYNTRLMRFHSPDSWSPFGAGGLNPYMYCAGDPVNRSDPTGHRPGFFDLIFGVKRFLSGDRGFVASGGGSGRAKAGGGILVNIQTAKQFKQTFWDRTSSHLPVERSFEVPALTGPGAFFSDFSKVGGFSSRSGSDSGSSSTRSSTRRIIGSNSTPPYGPPPPNNETMALSNADTFASSQPPSYVTVNRMSFNPPNDVVQPRFHVNRPPPVNTRQVAAALPPAPAVLPHGIAAGGFGFVPRSRGATLSDVSRVRQSN